LTYDTYMKGGSPSPLTSLVSIVKDILVANFFIKASVPIVGLGLLAVMCSSPSPEATPSAPAPVAVEKPAPVVSSACGKLHDEYMSLSEDGRFYSDYMTYDRDAYADAQSKASQVINKMHELGCPNARGNVGF
jgi:hypothetical protein